MGSSTFLNRLHLWGPGERKCQPDFHSSGTTTPKERGNSSRWKCPRGARLCLIHVPIPKVIMAVRKVEYLFSNAPTCLLALFRLVPRGHCPDPKTRGPLAEKRGGSMLASGNTRYHASSERKWQAWLSIWGGRWRQRFRDGWTFNNIYWVISVS